MVGDFTGVVDDEEAFTAAEDEVDVEAFTVAAVEVDFTDKW